MKNLSAPNRKTSYGKLTAALIAAWFIFAMSASALHGFENAANRVGIAVAVAAVAPILVFALWFAASEKFRQFALSLNPQLLTFTQSWRIVGFTFVLLQARGILPSARPPACSARTALQ